MDEHIGPYVFSFSRRAAPLTAMHLRNYLRLFSTWFKAKGGESLSDLTPELITRYFAERRAAWQPTTAAHHRWAIKGFLAHLYRAGTLLVNPWPEDLRFRPVRQRVRRVPSPVEALAHLKKNVSRVNVRLRNRAIFELAYGCGLRRCELARLNLSDLAEDSLRVHGKGGKERIVPLGKNARRHLLEYLKVERPRLTARCPDEPAVFVSFFGGRLGDSGYDWLNARHQDPKRPITLQTLRHACATHMLQGGASLPLLQKLLGHERLATTSIYTHVDLRELQTVLKRFHPRK